MAGLQQNRTLAGVVRDPGRLRTIQEKRMVARREDFRHKKIVSLSRTPFCTEDCGGRRGGAYSTAEGNDQLGSALKTATVDCPLAALLLSMLAAQPARAIVAANDIMSLCFSWVVASLLEGKSWGCTCSCVRNTG